MRWFCIFGMLGCFGFEFGGFGVIDLLQQACSKNADLVSPLTATKASKN
jgi:hypothetical protein